MTQQALAQTAQVAPKSQTGGRILQRKCDCGTHTPGGGECESCAHKNRTLQCRARPAGSGAGAADGAMPASGAGGLPLAGPVAARYRPGLGSLVDRVRIHDDAAGNAFAAQQRAVALTEGTDIYFAANAFAPHSETGRNLLAHELAHVWQQHSVNGTCLGRAAPPLQTKLSIGGGDDPLEREADRVADAVTMPGGAPPRIQRFSGAGAVAEAPQSVACALSGAGAQLEPALRERMEERLGHDFASVRVHTGAAAAQSARDLRAKAYTVGDDIVFAPGQYAPSTTAGRRLIAHELTHVVQQNHRVVQDHVQRDGEDQKPPAKMRFSFAVKVGEAMDSDKLLHELVKQYSKVDDKKADELIASGQWYWIGTPQSATAFDAQKKYVLVTVTVNGVVRVDPRDDKAQKEAFAKLPKEQQDAINAETDREFWDKTNYKPGNKLGGTADDKKMAETWKQFRDRLVQEKGLIDKMTPLMKQIIMNPEAIPPENYEQAARIINKLNTLSAEEMADYLSKVTAVTSDLGVLEGSVDRFLATRKQRKEEDKQREIIKTRLFFTGDLYNSYKEWKLQKQSASALTTTRAPTGELAQKAWERANAMEAGLNADLIKAGFKSGIPDFEKMIASYLDAFQLETGRIANDLLDKYAHVLFDAERKINDPAELNGLFQRIKGSGAKTSYEKSDSLKVEAADLRQQSSLATVQGAAHLSPGLSNQSVAKGREAQAESDKAESAVGGAGGGVSIVGEKKMDRRGLAFAGDEAALKGKLQEYITARREDIKTSRDAIRDHPELVFKLPDLLSKSYALQSIAAGSVYDEMIRDKISQIQIDELLIKLAWGALALALGAVSGGTGTVAVLAAAGAFTISAVQAVQEYKEYELKSGLSGAQLLSEDPSLFWVVASIVAAGMDLAAVGGAINDLKPAVTAFNETHDVAQFQKAIDGLSSIKAELKTNLVKAAESEAQYQKSVKDLLQSSGKAYAFAGVPDPEVLWNMGKLAYAALKRGINSFEKFLLELKAQKIIKSIEGLSTEEKAVLKQAWLNALEEDARLSKIQQIGERLPLNAEDFAGRTFSFDLAQNPVIKSRIIEKYGATSAESAERTKMYEALAKKYPDGVKFTAKGFPDFAPYTVTLPNGKLARFTVKTAGNRAKDFAEADRLAGITEEYRSAKELVWHHMEDGQTMILIPRDVHGAVKHSGGVSVVTNTVIEE